jgi:hypothetical protein
MNCPLSPHNFLISSVAYGNAQYAAVGSLIDDTMGVPLSGALMTSRDGVHWVQRQVGTTNQLQKIAFSDGHFLAVGANGTIVRSASIFDISLAVNAGSLALSIAGPAGLGYTIQTSTDLVSWRDLISLTNGQPSTSILRLQTPSGVNHLFYRTVSLVGSD